MLSLYHSNPVFAIPTYPQQDDEIHLQHDEAALTRYLCPVLQAAHRGSRDAPISVRAKGSSPA
jgi:hypothetical protein